MPLVSIIMPTYNREKVIKRSIISVLNQTFDNFELIIVDDCSSDNTEEIIKSFNDNRIKYIKHKKNLGANVARNTGILNSKGYYIAFQDSDDEWMANKLEKQINILEKNNNIDFVFTGFYLFDNNKKYYIPENEIVIKENSLFPKILKGNFITTSTVVLKKEILTKYGTFDPEMPRFQDWELWIRLLKKCKVDFLNEPLVNVYVQKDSISKNNEAAIVAINKIIEKNMNYLKNNKYYLSNLYFYLSQFYMKTKNKYQTRKYLFKSFFIDPLNINVLLKIIAILILRENYDIIFKYRDRLKNRFKNILKHTNFNLK